MLLLATHRALLEVMDKEPGIASFWVSAAVIGAAGHLAGRWRWWAGNPIIALLLLGALGPWAEWRDPFAGPAIAREAGASYPYHLGASKLAGSAATLAGMLRRRRVT
jgi:hypothetical protein